MGHGRVDEASPLLAQDFEKASAGNYEPNQAFLLFWNGGSISLKECVYYEMKKRMPKRVFFPSSQLCVISLSLSHFETLKMKIYVHVSPPLPLLITFNLCSIIV